MSKPRIIASLVIALAVLVATGWWAVKTFWLSAPASTQKVTVAHETITVDDHSTTIQTEAAKVSGEGHPYSPVPIYKAGEGGVTFPMPIYQPEPSYTARARKDKVQGTVALTAVVDASGNVADVKLVKGVGEGLDESAVETLRKWKFHPALKKGYPVPARVAVEVSFRMF
jgi:protein TonB